MARLLVRIRIGNKVDQVSISRNTLVIMTSNSGLASRLKGQINFTFVTDGYGRLVNHCVGHPDQFRYTVDSGMGCAPGGLRYSPYS